MCVREARRQASILLGLLTKRRLTAQRSYCNTCCMVLFPVVLVFFALLLLTVNIDFAGPKLELTTASIFHATTSGVKLGLPPALLTADNAATVADGLDWTIGGFDASNETLEGCSNAFPEVGADVLNYAFANPNPDRPAAAALALDVPFVNVTTPGGAPIPGLFAARNMWTLSFNASWVHTLPLLVSSVFDAALSRAAGGNQRITAAVRSLPQTKRQTALIDAFVSVFASIMILIPFAFVAASFISPLVAERDSGAPRDRAALA